MPAQPAKHLLRFRQVHLDFHTSGAIPGVGSKFNKRKFQEALRIGHVDSITLFSKCHHGFSYHPTSVGTTHPSLKRNLLAEQIEACREMGVLCPIYLSAGLDEVMAEAHPDWVLKRKDGSTFAPFDKPRFRVLRWNSPYLAYLCEQIEEVNTLWPDNDGIFLDIIGARVDYSVDSIRQMLAAGVDPTSDAEVARFFALVLDRYYARTTAAALKGNPNRPVFHNSGNIPIGAREILAWNSHLEMESLPTGGWGWDHFPLTARYAQKTGFDYLGMTGKFHTTWGEFGGFKRPASLLYECATMLSLGAKCSIGDQLHPTGEINRSTYELIGTAYADVESKQAWCDRVQPLATIGLLSSEENQKALRFHGQGSHSDEGAARMLLELHQPFVVLDEREAWTGLELVILPDSVRLTPALRKRLQNFLAKGGRVIASGASLLNETRTAFAVEAGVTLQGRSEFETSYLFPTAKAPAIPVRAPVVIHGGSWNASPKPGTAVLAGKRDPYFDRSWKAFCSHQHTPDAKDSPFPAITATRQVAWFAHDIFARYRHYGQPLYRDYFETALRCLLSDRLPVECNLPSNGRISTMLQPDKRRIIVHTLFAVPASRGGQPHEWIPKMEIIEELIPLHQVTCEIRVPKKIKSVRLVPENRAITFGQKDGRVSFTVERLLGHQMVEMTY